PGAVALGAAVVGTARAVARHLDRAIRIADAAAAVADGVGVDEGAAGPAVGRRQAMRGVFGIDAVAPVLRAIQTAVTLLYFGRLAIGVGDAAAAVAVDPVRVASLFADPARRRVGVLTVGNLGGVNRPGTNLTRARPVEVAAL